jgi:hypothetical protein
MAGSRKKLSEQSKRFIEKAREIGADEESSAADVLLGRLAKMPKEPRPATRSSARSERKR